MNKLIINLAPTGMIPQKSTTPYVPIETKEIINDVLECATFGVSMIHLHARDHMGKPTYEKEVYGDIIEGIRAKRPDLILIVSTSGRTYQDYDKRSDVLKLDGNVRPDMASLTLGSLNFMNGSSFNAPQVIMDLAKMMKEKGIKPELEVFDLGMVNYARYLIKKGLLDPPYYFNIILGNIASAQATLSHVALIISELPPDSFYSLGALGDSQKIINALGVIYADGVRVGLEDNIWFERTLKKLATNLALVKRVTHVASSLGRESASTYEVRTMLKIK